MRENISSGAKWESIVGYSRLVRVDRQVFVTGTTATLEGGGALEDVDAYAQSVRAIENIALALAKVGGTLEDVVRTRIFVTQIARDWELVGRAHREAFGDIRPATSMVEVKGLIAPWMLVEIEADAILGA